MQSPVDRRRYPRKRSSISVSVRPRKAESSKLSSCLAKDISEGGMSICCEDFFPVGETLFMKISIPSSSAPICMMSRVSRSRVINLGNSCVSGLMFTSFLQGDRDVFFSYLKEKSAQPA